MTIHEIPGVWCTLAGWLPDLGLRPSFPGLRGLNWAVIVLFFAAIYVFRRFYLVDGRRLTGKQRSSLYALRLMVALLLLAMILAPSVEVVTHEERKPVALVLLDDSTSMNYESARGDALVASNGKSERTRFHSALEALNTLQQELSLKHRVKICSFSDTVQLVRDVALRESPDQPALERSELLSNIKMPSGNHTACGDAICESLERVAGEKVSGIVLLSDGRSNGGKKMEEAGEAALRAGAPVHALTFGSEDPLRDLRIDKLDAPPEASLGDMLSFSLEIANYIEADLSVKIKLFEQDKLDQEKTIVLTKGVNRVTLTTIPRIEGVREYRVELPEFEDEIDTKNNKAIAHVEVLKKILRVLFVAGRPTREYKHLTTCLLRDPIIRVSCFLQSAHVDYVQQGNVVIDRLPRTTAEWQDYDVVLLYDINPKELGSKEISGLENSVSKGAGLMVIAGRTNGMGPLLQIHANKMGQMLPVEIDKDLGPAHEKLLETPFKVVRTSDTHPVFKMAASSSLNEEIWSHFPKFYWSHPVLSVKPSATVVLKKERVESGSDCVMAIQRFNEGVSIFLATDELWRWRRPYGNHDYDLFWTHVIRYLGETRLLGKQKQAVISTEKRAYAPGEKVNLKLSVLDPALFKQLQGENLFATVIDSDKAKQEVALSRHPQLPLYSGVYSSRQLGSFKVEARHVHSSADSEAKPLFESETNFKVELRSMEAMDTRADLEAMSKLAAQTSGTYLDHKTLNVGTIRELARSMPADVLSIPHQEDVDIWDGWMLLTILFALVTLEWSLRRYWGLL
jgi:hypothetical protein